MKYIISFSLFVTMIATTRALSINEILSNPTGDDSGREWIELYNSSDVPVDISTLTISIKGGTFVPITQVSGGTNIPARGYAIIGSTVSGATRFMLDYPAYTGPLFRSSISLVNTGVTSVEIKQEGITVDTLASYTAAKEGSSYAFISGNFVTGVPSPGEENKAQVLEEDAPKSPNCILYHFCGGVLSGSLNVLKLLIF